MIKNIFTSFDSIQTLSKNIEKIPKHVAIIMDGNGRWANKRFLSRVAGHSHGLQVVRKIVQACSKEGVSYLTLFAFSSENWRRPSDEVGFLMKLFLTALKKEVIRLNKNQVRLRIIGHLDGFNASIRKKIVDAEQCTANNTGLNLTIAANYGGRWDILNAINQAIKNTPNIIDTGVTEKCLNNYLSMHFAPEPDLFIRTGGEQRMSNFLLWQLAYTELYFTNTLWPDFDEKALANAFQWYSQRERKFGRVSKQIEKNE